MPKFECKLTFDATNQLQATAVQTALSILLDSIKDKQNLIELGKIIKQKPGLMEQAIPYLPYLNKL